MRAAAQAHPSEVSASTARQALVRLLLAVVATLSLLAVWSPTVVRGQGTPPGAATSQRQPDTSTVTHVVKAGESLWYLAERYFGDGHQWQELARRNSLAITNNSVLYVGQTLRVPVNPLPTTQRVAAGKEATVPPIARKPAAAASTAASLAAQTADKADAAPTAPSSRALRDKATAAAAAGPTVKSVAGAPAKKTGSSTALVAAKAAGAAADSNANTPRAVVAETPTVFARHTADQDSAPHARTMPSDSSLAPRTTTHIGLIGADDLKAARSAREAETVFLRHVPDQAEVDAQARALSRADAPAPRRGEYEAAPFSIEPAALLKSGRVLRRIGAPAGGSLADPQRLTIADALEIAAPSGVTLSVGDRLVSVHVHTRSKTVRVAIPTGVVRVVRATPGKPILAVVQAQTGGIEQGQPLFVIEGAAAPLSSRSLATATNDVETNVRWIDGTESLPTLQSYILLGAGSAQGVRAGDEFDLHTGKGPTSGGEQLIARARIVRVGAQESSAIIVRQERAEIAVGVPAHRVARAP